MEAIKIILIILAIFAGIFLLLSSDTEIARFFRILSPGDQREEEVFEDIIMSLDSRNVFSGAKFHAPSKADINDIVQIPQSPNLFYAIADGSIYYSNDFAVNWRPVALPENINENIGFHRLFVNYQRPNEISALAGEDGKIAIYKTVDGFISMQKIYDIESKIFQDVSRGRNISIMMPVDGRILIGTSK